MWFKKSFETKFKNIKISELESSLEEFELDQNTLRNEVKNYQQEYDKNLNDARKPEATEADLQLHASAMEKAKHYRDSKQRDLDTVSTQISTFLLWIEIKKYEQSNKNDPALKLINEAEGTELDDVTRDLKLGYNKEKANLAKVMNTLQNAQPSTGQSRSNSFKEEMEKIKRAREEN